MTTIGYATLQIIPSLKGVTEAIEKQLEEAGKASGKGYSEEFNKQVTKDVKVDEAITEGTKTGGGGGIGKAAKEAAGEFGKGFREGVQDALSQTAIDDSLVKWGGRVGQVLKPAVEAGLEQVSQGVRDWSSGIADDIRSGDVAGATQQITDAITNTTNIISTIGDTFGIETGAVESASQNMVTSLSRVGTKVQEILDNGGEMGNTFRGAEDGIKRVSDISATLGGKDFAGDDTKFGKSISKLALIGDAYDVIKMLNGELEEWSKKTFNINLNRNPYSDISQILQGNNPFNDQPQRPPSTDTSLPIIGPNTTVTIPQPKDVFIGGSATQPGRQHGGVITGPSGTDNVLSWLTAGEGVITKAAMGRGGAQIMAALNAGWTPSAGLLHALIPGFDSGGVVAEIEQLGQLAARYGLTMGSERRSEPGSFHNTGEAGDFSSSNIADMLAFAQAVYSNYGGNLAELIFDAPGWANNVKDGKNVGPFGQFYTMRQAGYHGDHVHVAVHGGTSLGAGSPGSGDIVVDGGDGVPTVPLTQTASGAWTSPNTAWAALIERESGGQNIPQVITDANSGGNEAEGIFQITPGTWKSYGGTDFAPNPLAATPQEQAIVAARILHGNPSGNDWGTGPGRENAEDLLAGLGTTRPKRSAPTDRAAPTSPDIGPVASPPATPASSSVSMPSSISGLPGWGLEELGSGVGKAAGAAVSGQVASALGVFGVPDSPGWLKGISQFVGGISIGGPSNSAAPLAAAPTLGSQLRSAGNMHGGRAGQQPGPGVVYNIAARDTEDAFIRAQRQERERVGAKLSRF